MINAGSRSQITSLQYFADDARAVISAVDPKSVASLRDRALLLFLYIRPWVASWC